MSKLTIVGLMAAALTLSACGGNSRNKTGEQYFEVDIPQSSYEMLYPDQVAKDKAK